MGFGIMFFGYFITYIMALNQYGAFFRFAGYLTMAYGAKKLSEYQASFMWSGYVSVLLTLMSVLRIVSDYTLIIPMAFLDAFVYVEAALVLIYHILLLLAIRQIAKETEVDKIEGRAVTNIFFISLYFLLSVIGMLPTSFSESYEQNMALPITLLYLAWIILDLVLLLSCYSNICDEGDLDMQRKPSKFEFVNRVRAQLDEKSARARESALQYKKEKADRKKKK